MTLKFTLCQWFIQYIEYLLYRTKVFTSIKYGLLYTA